MINLLKLDFQKYDSKEMRTLYKKNKQLFSKISNNIITINCLNLPKSILEFISKKPEHTRTFITHLFIKIPLKILLNINKIFNTKTDYYGYLQDSIIDGLERKTGDIREKSELKIFIKKYFLEFTLKSAYLILLIEIIKLFRKVEKINAIYCDQNAGFPFGGITSYCYINKILICSSSIQERPYLNSSNLILLVSKKICDDRLAFPHDLKLMSKISESKLDAYINLFRNDYKFKRDPLSNPDYIKFDENHKIKDINYYKNLNNNNKKNGVVMLHLFTDMPRKRCEGIWLNNYLEWFNTTLDYCSKNKNINWFFKEHPFHTNISTALTEEKNHEIESKIKSKGFTYIKSINKFLHDDVSKLASVIVTCHGTCKLEFPALYRLPVISCIGYKDLFYDATSQALTASNAEEYEKLILNAHKLYLSDEEVRKFKELLVFYKCNSGKDINEKIKLRKFLDQDNNEIIRNF